MFQFTPLREGRRERERTFLPPKCFNSRPCERGDGLFEVYSLSRGVSIHAPARGATAKRARDVSGRAVSIHAPARGATVGSDAKTAPDTFQFTPLREGRLGANSANLHNPLVSIHAPARGATTSLLTTGYCSRVSIHAPARGATFNGLEITPPKWRFNSRPCERGDPRPYQGIDKPLIVSIHAPARGATDGTKGPHWSMDQFQFTPLREGRLSAISMLSVEQRVSIHAPARGATYSRFEVHCFSNVSIHAPARGATGWDARRQTTPDVSIHAPARGATKLLKQNGVDMGFNSRPCERGDGRKHQRSHGRPVSIHAPARGATCAWANSLTPAQLVSIHAPARGATHCSV